MKTKLILVILFILLCGLLQSQNFSSKLDNFQKDLPEMDFIIMPFDMDNRVSIGKLKDDGTLEVNIPEFSSIQLPSNVVHDDLLNFEYIVKFRCGNSSDLKVSESLKGFRGGYFALWREGKRSGWAGSVFAVSNKELIPWLEDDAYMQPVLGSYYEIIYVTEDAEIKTTCENTWEIADFKIDMEYQVDLNLKKGYNLIEYEILDIFETNSNEITNKPNKIKIKSPTDFSGIIWTAKYF
ncbi:hypothetical protein FJ651_03170 [Paucihalobacter ruber]|uniref:Uncharacterized protein n=1 Tax=Paucihalobacter ruber TaxID=2567861 RepID=A0A506PQE8_9FLAO|nr:hypothetical protein [Paucihalobacter ruber]TPV35934.1 hypothetical protein FJ651_03170 [Paucihalobacter ruber]